jgi:hypothetical protein
MRDKLPSDSYELIFHSASHFYTQFTMSTTTVTTKLTYFTLPADGSKPWVDINVDSATGKRGQNWEPTEHIAEVEDLRGNLSAASLDTTGFQFFHHPTKHTAFDNDEDIQREYYPESIDFIKQTTGATRVVVFDHSTHLAARAANQALILFASHPSPPPGPSG